MTCTFCRRNGHVKDDCPEVGLILVRVDEPTPTPIEVNEALAHRAIGWRMVAGQLLRELRAKGFQPSPETVALYPEPFDP